jgi:uncharacterized protein
MDEPTLAAWETRIASHVRQNGASDTAHDVAHVARVVKNAKNLAAEEAERCDLAVIIPAAWLHDIVAVPKDSPERAKASRLAAAEAERFSRAIRYPEESIPSIVHAIEAHSFSANIQPCTLEAKIVQDADRLEALGAIGVARCFPKSRDRTASLRLVGLLNFHDHAAA